MATLGSPDTPVFIPTFMPWVPGEPPCGGFKRDGWVKAAKNGDFRSLNPETIDDKHIVTIED